MEKFIRKAAVILCELITVGAIVGLAVQGNAGSRIPLAVATLGLVLLPSAFERLSKCKMWTPLYVFCVLYAIGPMLGYSLNFYYLIPCWDKILHISGGVVFAIVGFALFTFLTEKNTKHFAAGAIFALCFSMALSMGWEFCEFGSDCFLGTDTQADRVVSTITSHRLTDEMGGVGTIGEIKTVTINGEEMAWGGYLDIGLYDTMMDMLLETLGAVAVVAFYLIDRGKHPLIRFLPPA